MYIIKFAYYFLFSLLKLLKDIAGTIINGFIDGVPYVKSLIKVKATKFRERLVKGGMNFHRRKKKNCCTNTNEKMHDNLYYLFKEMNC